MIKECPFCGAKPIFVVEHADGRNEVFHLTHNPDCFFNLYGKSVHTFYSEEEETKMWNTRSIQQERIEKLNQINSNETKTSKIKLTSIKDSDGWVELAHELKFDKFQKDHPDLDEDEIADKFYTEVVSKNFKYGEFADIEIVVDENFRIIDGHIGK